MHFPVFLLVLYCHLVTTKFMMCLQGGGGDNRSGGKSQSLPRPLYQKSPETTSVLECCTDQCLFWHFPARKILFLCSLNSVYQIGNFRNHFNWSHEGNAFFRGCDPLTSLHFWLHSVRGWFRSGDPQALSYLLREAVRPLLWWETGSGNSSSQIDVNTNISAYFLTSTIIIKRPAYIKLFIF